MTEYLLWQRNIQCHEHDRPVDSVEAQNVLAYDVYVCRPVFFKELRLLFVCRVIAESGDVV